jgi:hypothetical protein
MTKIRTVKVGFDRLSGTKETQVHTREDVLLALRQIPYVSGVWVEDETDLSKLLIIRVDISAPKKERDATYRTVMNTLRKHGSLVRLA